MQEPARTRLQARGWNLVKIGQNVSVRVFEQLHMPLTLLIVALFPCPTRARAPRSQRGQLPVGSPVLACVGLHRSAPCPAARHGRSTLTPAIRRHELLSEGVLSAWATPWLTLQWLIYEGKREGSATGHLKGWP